MATFREGLFWYWTDQAEKAERPPLRVRVIRVASRKRKNDVWLVTDVLDPGRWSAESAGRLYRMRWESECFFKTYKRVIKNVCVVSETTVMVAREAEGSLLACQLLLAQGALALKAGGPRRPRRGQVQRRGGTAGDPAGIRGVRRAVAEGELPGAVARGGA